MEGIEQTNKIIILENYYKKDLKTIIYLFWHLEFGKKDHKYIHYYWVSIDMKFTGNPLAQKIVAFLKHSI